MIRTRIIFGKEFLKNVKSYWDRIKKIHKKYLNLQIENLNTPKGKCVKKITEKNLYFEADGCSSLQLNEIICYLPEHLSEYPSCHEVLQTEGEGSVK